MFFAIFYTREFKLHVSKWYIGNGHNIARTAFLSKVGCKQVREWVQNEELIVATKLNTRTNKSGR